MQWKKPKNTEKYLWTQHVTEKMHYYGLSEQKVLGVIKNAKRTETGIAKDTVAVMVPVGNISKNAKPSKWKRSFVSIENEGASWNQEIWVMYQVKNSDFQNQNSELGRKNKDPKIRELQEKISGKKQLIIISAWRYPGVSPEKDPIPEEIWREIEENALI